MAGPQRKAKKPGTFQYLPKNRGNEAVVLTLLDLTLQNDTAKKLKRSWIDSKKLKSQWKAQKKREGIWSRSSSQPDDRGGEITEQASPNDVSDLPLDSDRKATEETSTTNKVRKRWGTNAALPHGTSKDPSRQAKGQPNMKLRMNAMLEKIKRDLC
ncbi:hypothetical protein EDC04DRAFT_2634196 [Pisolithus marmoratus]|nr:hypothetical protein EDC04DRAFT_2634196 [Pisolithus marmoratus]